MIKLNLEFRICRKRRVINIFFAFLCLQGIYVLHKEFDQNYRQTEIIDAQSNALNNISTGCDKIARRNTKLKHFDAKHWCRN